MKALLIANLILGYCQGNKENTNVSLCERETNKCLECVYKDYEPWQIKRCSQLAINEVARDWAVMHFKTEPRKDISKCGAYKELKKQKWVHVK